jgi:hypothetical protein
MPRSGSGSFYHQAKNSKKTLIPTGLRIPIDLMRIRIQFWIQGFYDQIWKKKFKAEKKNLYFFDQKLQFTYP